MKTKVEVVSEETFLKRLGGKLKSAGVNLVYTSWLLYYTLAEDDVPVKVKGTIVGALSYFLLPMDIIPDFVPVTGYSDDLVSLIAAIAVTAAYVTPEVKRKAQQKTKNMFGAISKKEFDKMDKDMNL